MIKGYQLQALFIKIHYFLIKTHKSAETRLKSKKKFLYTNILRH
nr:MAG TPA_asm: hypothetical protein [Caudoviricetes sp.]